MAKQETLVKNLVFCFVSFNQPGSVVYAWIMVSTDNDDTIRRDIGLTIVQQRTATSQLQQLRHQQVRHQQLRLQQLRRLHQVRRRPLTRRLLQARRQYHQCRYHRSLRQLPQHHRLQPYQQVLILPRDTPSVS